ncbi:MAG: DUF4340 domain-containing protein [Verrucomicrobiota bacterium]
MKTRTTVLLLLIVVAIGTYIRFYESKRPNTEEANRRAQNVVNFDRDEIDGVTIQNGDDRIELKRRDKTWRLEAPVQDLADSAAVDSLLFDLDGWQKESTIGAKELEHDKNKMAEFGLAKAKLRLKLAGKEAPPEIWFGNNAALENRVYVRLENSKDVFLAPKTIRDAISKKPEEFRDHKLTDIVATQVNRLVLKTPAGEMELQKQADHWEIVKPLRARADDQKVNDLIAQITNSRIQQFVADDRGDLHPYGLAEPRGAVTLFSNEKANETSAKEQGQVLQIGGMKDKDQVYVRFTSRNFIYTLPKKLEEILLTTPNDLRDRHLVRFDQNQLDRVTVTPAGREKIVLARKGEGWTIATENGAAANGTEVRRLLDLLSKEQVTGFAADVASDLPKYGLDQPQLTLTLSSFASENTAETSAGEHPLATIAFGRVEGENVYARVNEEPFVVTIRRGLLDEIFTSPAQYRELAIFKWKPEQIHRLGVVSDKEQIITRAPNNQWQWITGSGEINVTDVQSLLNTLAGLRAVRWVPDAPAAAFANPQLVINFTTSPDDKAGHQLTVGEKGGDGLWLAKTNEQEGVFGLSAPDLNALRLPLAQAKPPAAAAGSPSVTPSPATTPLP